MKIKESFLRKLFIVINTLLLSVISIVMLYPLVYVLFASLSNSVELMSYGGILWKPLGFNFEAYRSVSENPMIASGYINTLIIVGVSLLLNIVLTSIAAYFFSRKNVLFQKPIFFYVIFTMYFSGGMIPFFLTVKNLGLYDSRWAVILPTAISTYNMIVMKTSLESIPDSLEEAAKIDGANHMHILFRIVMPLSLPILSVMVLYYAVAHWNAWFNAMIFLQDRNKFPLQLILREILIQNNTDLMNQDANEMDAQAISESIKYAIIIVSTLPILCVYPFLQKYFVKGVMSGAVKG
ncbi:MAG: carbohydrate ABC transporter permease [Clostridia bacterium]|nr:carbohydrate ABC transporter permease [Clostridia bacterium]